MPIMLPVFLPSRCESSFATAQIENMPKLIWRVQYKFALAKTAESQNGLYEQRKNIACILQEI